MMTETNCSSTPTVLVYNEQTYSYEVFHETGTMGENPLDTFTITLPSERKVEKILEFQEGLSSEDREHIYLLVKDYVLTHPNKEDRHKFLNSIIKKGLGIKIKGPYLVYLVDIIQRSLDISLGQDSDYSHIQNYPQIKSALELQNSRLMIDRDSTLSLIKILSALLSPFHDETIEPNGVITTADRNGMTVSYKSRNIYCSYDSLVELPFIKTMSEYDGMPIPTYVCSYRSKSTGKIFISEIIKIQSVKQLLENLKAYVSDGDFINAARYFSVIQEVLSPYIKGDIIPFCVKIRTALEPARLHTPDCVGIKINFSQQSFQVTHPKSQVAFHNIEDNVQKLLSEDLNNEAIQMLIDGLCSEEITVKRKSDLYKILVGTYCKLELFDDAIKVNKQWINHCIAHNISSDKRLARMYTLLAKLEATVTGYEEDALENLKKAMQYDPDSEFYSKLYDTFIETFESRK